jgi:hypothetical protein
MRVYPSTGLRLRDYEYNVPRPCPPPPLRPLQLRCSFWLIIYRTNPAKNHSRGPRVIFHWTSEAKKCNVSCHRSCFDPTWDLNDLYVEKTPGKSQFGKKSAKVYHCLYSSTEQLQMALWTYIFLWFRLNNEKSLHTLPLWSLPLLSLLL